MKSTKNRYRELGHKFYYNHQIPEHISRNQAIPFFGCGEMARFFVIAFLLFIFAFPSHFHVFAGIPFVKLGLFFF